MAAGMRATAKAAGYPPEPTVGAPVLDPTVINLADRVVHIAGVTTRPDEAWMLQIGRNLTDEKSGALATTRYLIIDRDTKYSERFRKLVEEDGRQVIP